MRYQNNSAKNDWATLSTPLIAGLVLTCSTAVAQEDTGPNTEPVARYMGASTDVVGWVDISQINVDEFAGFVQTINPNAGDMAQPKIVKNALQQQGVTKIFWVSRLKNLYSGPEAAVVPAPAENIESVYLILNALAVTIKAEAVIDNDCVLVGSAKAIKDLKTRKTGNPNGEFVAAANTIGFRHGIVISTANGQLTPLQNILPQIPDLDSASVTRIKELLDGVRLITFSGDLPPAQTKLQIVMQTESAAGEFAGLINDWMKKRIGDAAAKISLKTDGRSVIHETASMKDVHAAIGNLTKLAAPARKRAADIVTVNSLRHIALGLHNFHDSYGFFPPQALANDKGERLLSWRVLILPYIEQVELYQQFHLDEPWDSEHNKTLISKMPDVYRMNEADDRNPKPGTTRFVGPLTADSVFGRKGAGVTIRDIKDGTSNTLMVATVAAEKAVVWTQPVDVEVDARNPIESIIGQVDRATKFPVAFCDGSVRTLSNAIDPATLNALLSIAGKEIIKADDLK